MKIEKRIVHKTLLTSLEQQLNEEWKPISKKMGDVEFLRHSLFPIKVYFFIDSMCWQTPTSPPMTNIWRVHLGCSYSAWPPIPLPRCWRPRTLRSSTTPPGCMRWRGRQRIAMATATPTTWIRLARSPSGCGV